MRTMHEPPMTRAFHETIGGLLVEEFPVVKADRKNHIEGRWIDGVIVLDRKARAIDGRKQHPGYLVDLLRDKDLVCVQSKNAILNMLVGGQAIISAELLRRHFEPRSVRSVAVCRRTDAALAPVLAKLGVEVFVVPRE